MCDKKVYTAEAIAEVKDEINLQVVLQELKKSIEEQLKKCGLYYRLFSRVKDNESLALKLNSGEYGDGEEDKKVQDLLGIRVVLYYSDDLAPCRYILEKTFNRNGQWSQNAMTVNEFQATKINGVFEIPQKLLEMIDEHSLEQFCLKDGMRSNMTCAIKISKITKKISGMIMKIWLVR